MHFHKNHLIQDMCQIHGELTRDFRNNVLKNLVLRTFWRVFFGEVKSRIKTNQDIGISLEAANLKKKFK